jgi:hypothetical protein
VKARDGAAWEKKKDVALPFLLLAFVLPIVV